MSEDNEDEVRLIKAHRVFVRLVLPPYTLHFKSPGYIKDATMTMLDNRVCKETLHLTTNYAKIRLVIGSDRKFWSEMVLVFRAAIPSLERRSFSVWDPSSVDYESTSSVLIATHYPTLWKDLERLNDLVAIARNVLTKSSLAQDLAAECAFEEEIFRLINCCVRVTARGYDGDAGTGDEEKWQWIVSYYKKLLITSLQFLNNLTADNERRKLMLWVSLFDNLTEGGGGGGSSSEDLNDNTEQNALMPEPPVSTSDILVALGETSQPKIDAAADALRAKRLLAPKGQLRPSRPVSGYVLFVKWHTSRVKEELGPNASATDVAVELSSQWARIPEAHRKEWSVRFDELMAKYDKDLELYNGMRETMATEKAHSEKSQIDRVALRIAHIEGHLSDRMHKDVPHVAPLDLPPAAENDSQSLAGDAQLKVREEDFKMLFTAEAGSRILETGKAELLKRLETVPPEPLRLEHTQLTTPQSPLASSSEAPQYSETQSEGAGDTADPADSDEGQVSEDEEYGSSTEDGRGLLTDVPLILGPSEIEVLPMIIMSGIVPPPRASADSPKDYHAVVNMHTVRCHLLLAQDNGKNLLRELLIFVAAWDLRDEELYFKFMLKIMEGILVNGLMPYAYHAFRESRSKDIISPAQAVIMKLLTNIFRSRAEQARLSQGSPDGSQQYPGRVDVHIVNFIFTEFRQHIIPQICALIFLQGKIHQDLAAPEDFPLNLWDMERMYEGVYQYLEFFAVLTEEQTWKDVMAEWEVASELVTMLKELEIAIPKLHGGGGPLTTPSAQRRAVSAGQAGHVSSRSPTPSPIIKPESTSAAKAAVDGVSEAQVQTYDLPDPSMALPTSSENGVFEGDTPLAYPEEAQDEPSDFEWRNLKKLTVLVLSSLIWKNKAVQDQVRRHGGLEALVGCCKHDEHNPYIREHAIMCLRFAVEGNAENAEVIRRMAGVGAEAKRGKDVPKEVLDTQCYETFMDGKGQVGLRRKQQITVPVAASQMLSMQAAAVQAVQGAMTDMKAAAAAAAAGGGGGGSGNAAGFRQLTTKLAAGLSGVVTGGEDGDDHEWS